MLSFFCHRAALSQLATGAVDANSVEKRLKIPYSARKTPKFREVSKTPLTKGERGDILKIPPQNGGVLRIFSKKVLKKLKKSLKKYLTNGEIGGIIEKLSGTGDEPGGHRSLKIGQQNFEH